MSKNFKKIIVLMFALVLAFTSLAGCNPNSGRGGVEGELDIKVLALGYGTEQVFKIAEEFAKVVDYKVNVKQVITSEESSLITTMEAGDPIGDVCLFTSQKLWSLWDAGYAVQIDDVLNGTPQGESLTVKEKLRDDIAEVYEYRDGHYYSLPWSMDNMGFVYNKTSLDKFYGAGNWTLPKTTEEMFAMGEYIKTKAKADNKTANYFLMTYSGLDSYWQIAYKQWWAQYQGLENYNYANYGYYYDPTNPDANSDGYAFAQAAENVTSQIGLQRAYEVCDRLISPGNNYCHSHSYNMNYAKAQIAWLGEYNGTNYTSVFMPNGDWIYQEAGSNIEYYDQEIGLMQVPVISSIVETLSFWSEPAGKTFDSLTTAKKAAYDETLQAIIEYVDGGQQGTVPTHKGVAVSAADIARIAEARSSLGCKASCQMFIPSTTPAGDIAKAKEFMSFYASSLATEVYSQYSYSFSPFYQGEDVARNYFMEEVAGLLDKCPRYVMEFQSHRLASAIDWDAMGDPAAFFNSDKDNQGRDKTGELAFKLVYEKAQENWVDWVRQTGYADCLK